jgi:predicted nucleic acid-binding protein
LSVYFDTSTILSIILVDSHSEKAGRWYRSMQASVIVSDLAGLEVCAVVSRQFRAKRLSRSSADNALSDFEAFRAESERMTCGPNEFGLAEKLIRNFETKLSAPDALHLASAKNAGAALATLDVRLAEAARGQGVEVAEVG